MSDKISSISIPCNDQFVIDELVDWAKKACKLSLQITEPEDRDGVVFYTISSKDLTFQTAYDIGYYYSGLISRLRKKKKISW